MISGDAARRLRCINLLRHLRYIFGAEGVFESGSDGHELEVRRTVQTPLQAGRAAGGLLSQ